MTESESTAPTVTTGVGEQASDTRQQQAAVPPGPRSTVSWLALLLSLAVAAYNGWQWWSTEQQRNAAPKLAEQLVALEGRLSEQADDTGLLDGRIERLESELKAADRSDELATLAGQVDALRQAIAAETENRSQDQQGLVEVRRDFQAAEARIDAFDRRLQELAARIQSLTSADRRGWRLEEAGHLVRLANDRLRVAGDRQAAVNLLQTAEQALAVDPDPAWHLLRTALNRDLGQLRSAADLDVGTLANRLSTLRSQVDGLRLQGFNRATAEAAAEEQPAAAGWTGAWQRLWKGLSGFIVIRSDATPAEPLLPPQQEIYLRENMRLALQQAELALLRGEQGLYKSALDRAAGWLPRWFEREDSASRAFSEELDALRQVDWPAALPGLDGTLAALRQLKDAQ